MRLHGRLHVGPALRRLRLPVRSTVVSVAFHAALVLAVLSGNAVWGGSQPKPVIVNLVPAATAVGDRSTFPRALARSAHARPAGEPPGPGRVAARAGAAAAERQGAADRRERPHAHAGARPAHASARPARADALGRAAGL